MRKDIVISVKIDLLFAEENVSVKSNMRQMEINVNNVIVFLEDLSIIKDYVLFALLDLLLILLQIFVKDQIIIKSLQLTQVLHKLIQMIKLMRSIIMEMLKLFVGMDWFKEWKNVMIKILMMEMDVALCVKYNLDISVLECHLNAKKYLELPYQQLQRLELLERLEQLELLLLQAKT